MDIKEARLPAHPHRLMHVAPVARRLVASNAAEFITQAWLISELRLHCECQGLAPLSHPLEGANCRRPTGVLSPAAYFLVTHQTCLPSVLPFKKACFQQPELSDHFVPACSPDLCFVPACPLDLFCLPAYPLDFCVLFANLILDQCLCFLPTWPPWLDFLVSDLSVIVVFSLDCVSFSCYFVSPLINRLSCTTAVVCVGSTSPPPLVTERSQRCWWSCRVKAHNWERKEKKREKLELRRILSALLSSSFHYNVFLHF